MKLKRLNFKGYPIHREGLTWLLVAMVVAILPHVLRTPIWVLALAALTITWREMAFRGRWRLPGRWVKVVLVVASGVGLALTFGASLVVETTVTCFIVAFSLKLLEMRERNDVFLVVFLALFLIGTAFIFDQSILMALYLFASVGACCLALMGAASGEEMPSVKGASKGLGLLVLQTVPFMLVLFFLFPRIGPIWSLPLQTGQARTGISDVMDPGSIGNLSKSDELAFRAEFKGEIPPKPELYWRGLVLSDFDGRSWRQSSRREPAYRTPTDNPPVGNVVHEYSVILEPTDQHFAFVLRDPKTLSNNAFVGGDDVVRIKNPVQQSVRYDMQALAGGGRPADNRIAGPDYLHFTRLPSQGNEQTRALAEQWFDEASSQQAYINRILNHFRQQEFFYTLKPPILDANVIDAFLFDTRRGFCEHYASSFAFMMRAVGIPARVIVGYQGGEISGVGGYLLVHQFDAHAWVEVWQPERGWVRYDPTAAVSPLRIEQGLEQALAEEGTFLADRPLSAIRFRNSNVLGWVRLQLDYVNFAWKRWVVGYDGRTQLDIFSQWFNGVSFRTLGHALLITLVVGLVLAALLLFRPGKQAQLDAVAASYLQFCRKLARLGIERQRGETPTHFHARLVTELPQRAEQVSRITRLYEHLSYVIASRQRYAEPQVAAQVQLLKKQVARFRA